MHDSNSFVFNNVMYACLTSVPVMVLFNDEEE